MDIRKKMSKRGAALNKSKLVYSNGIHSLHQN